MNIFNTREVATIIMILSVFFWCLSREKLRESIKSVVSAFFHYKIILSFTSILIYFVFTLIILGKIDFWDLSLLKDSIIWLLFTGAVLNIKYATSKDLSIPVKDIILDNFKIMVFIQFLINTYTFSLIGELIFVPIMTFLIMLLAVAETEEKYKDVKKFLDWLLTIIGLSLLYHVFTKALDNYNSLGSVKTFKQLALAPILCIFFLPFIYLFVLFTSYERLFVSLECGREKSTKLKRHTKFQVIKICKFSLQKVRNACYKSSYKLVWIESMEDVKEKVDIYKKEL